MIRCLMMSTSCFLWKVITAAYSFQVVRALGGKLEQQGLISTKKLGILKASLGSNACDTPFGSWHWAHATFNIRLRLPLDNVTLTPSRSLSPLY